MLIIDRYILKVWALNFIIILGFIFSLFFCQEVYNSLLDFLRAKRSIFEIFYFYWISLVILTPMLIPISYFISILFTIQVLKKTQQLNVLKSCGLSLLRISKIFIQISVVFSLVILFLSLFYIPNLVEKKNNFLSMIKNNSEAKLVESESYQLLTYENFYKNRLWFIEDFNQESYMGAYTILHQMDASGKEINRVIAKKSFYDKDLNTWVFLEGTELFFDPISGDPLRSIQFNHKQFVEFSENPNDFLLFNRKPSTLSFNELKELISLTPKELGFRRHYLIEYYGFFMAPFLSVLFVGISIPFLSKGIFDNSYRSLLYAFVAVAMFFLTRGFFEVLGQQSLLPPLLAVLLPYLIFSLASFKLYWQK